MAIGDFPRRCSKVILQSIVVSKLSVPRSTRVLRQAFDSNFTTKPVWRGSGLGQVQRFVKESGRALEIKSEVGAGTAARMMLLPVSIPADGNSVDLSNSNATF
jgi:hypothetical protein